MRNILSILSSIILFISCSSDNENITPPVQVYIAGYSVLNQESPQATLFKNGIEQPLQSNIQSKAIKVIVHNNDVYVLGNYFDINSTITSNSPFAGATTVVLWKNGAVHWQQEGVIGHDFVIDNNDVYISGVLLSDTLPEPAVRSLVYWKNGVQAFQAEAQPNLPDSENYSNSKIFLKDNEVHLTGCALTSSFSKTVYYKNNELLYTLLKPTNYLLSGLVVNANNEPFISFKTCFGVNEFWRNGNFIPLGEQTCINNLKIFNNDVYFVGSSNNQPMYIKNETFVNLPYSQVTFPNGLAANDLFIKNDQKYVISDTHLWINETFTSILNYSNNFIASSIYVD
jgi:hypothetical protein